MLNDNKTYATFIFTLESKLLAIQKSLEFLIREIETSLLKDK